MVPGASRPLLASITDSVQLPTALMHATRTALFATLGAVVSLGLAAPASGQVVRGAVTEAGSGASVQGAFVSLMDSTDARAASTLSDATGSYMLRAPSPGTYRLRTERIGFETAVSDPLTVVPGETLRHDVVVPSAAVELEGISVSAERQCDVQSGSGEALSQLWEEIRKAFSVAEWVEESGIVRYRIRRYSRTMDLETMTVRDETTRARTGFAEQPFVAPEPSSLEEHGYVQRRDGEVYYHGPDVEALLSRGFTRTHCFRISRNRDPESLGLVGLEFTPVEDREVPDIRGTLWVDEATAELRRLDFRYTGLEGVRRAEELGGQVHFRRLPTGAWIVEEWSIRMPVRGKTQQLLLEGPERNREVLAGIQEVGGEVLELSTTGGDLDIAGDRATLRGEVWDSLTSEPLSGARVFLNGTSHSTTTGEDGSFTLTGLQGGRYSVAFHHDRVSRRGLYIPPREVEVTEGEERNVRLALPSGPGMAVAACRTVHDSTSAPPDRRAILAGAVQDAVTGAPVSGASVRVTWSGGAGEGGGAVEAEVDDQGRYRFCTLPEGAEVTVEASFVGRKAAATGVRLAAGEPTLQNVEMPLTQPTPVVVRVKEHETGVPVEGASVTLEGVSEAALTDREGRASFPAVSPGMHGMEIEHLSYGTVTDSILVRSAETVRVTVTMATEAIALDPIEVEVEGRATTGIGMMGDVEARGTRGDVMTTEEIDEVVHRVSSVPSLLRTANIPGLSITNVRLRTGGGDIPAVCIETSRRSSPTMGEGCNMVTVYLDDRRLPNPVEYLLNLDPGNVGRIEVLSPTEAGSIYGLQAQNGVVLIYTRTGNPR